MSRILRVLFFIKLLFFIFSAANANSIILSSATPTDIFLSNSAINENITAPAILGSFSTQDFDLGDTFTYSLVNGTGSTDNNIFTISGTSLSITQSPNFSNQSSYSIRVRTTDAGGNFFEKTFTITVNDITKPVISLPANSNANATTGQCAYSVSGTEFNPTSVIDNSGNIASLTYSIQRVLPNPNLITENFNTGSWNTANFQIGSPNGSVVNGAYQSATADNRGTLSTVNNWVPSVNNPLYVSATLTFDGFAIAFIGTRSDGLKNPNASNEPSNSQYFRIHNFNDGQTDISRTGYTGRPGNTFYNNPVRIQFVDNGINITGTFTNTVTNQVLSFNQSTGFSSGFWKVVFSGSNVNWDDIKISLGPHEYLQETLNGSNNLAGTSLAIGENTIVWSAADNAGNRSSETMKVTVVDSQKPTIVASANVEEFTPTGTQIKSITIIDAAISDNCSATTLTWILTGATTGSGTNQIGTRMFNRGLTTVSYTVTDAAGNQENTSFTVSVKEAQNINFGAITPGTYGDADFQAVASASSGLSISYTSSNTDVATIVNGKIHITGAGTSTITANQSGNNLYQAAASVVQTLTINKKALTATVQNITKIYDGSDAAIITFDNFTTAGGLVAGDAVGVSYGTATYNNKNVGTNKAITITGLALTGDDKDNYSLNSLNVLGEITKQAINVTAQADNKVYDGTTTSNVVPLTSTLANGDNITTQPTQAFDNKNAGTAKTLTASGLIINDGNNGANYNISYLANSSGVITRQTVNVTAQADNKVYDGTTTSNLVPVTAALSVGDNTTTQPTQAFDNKNSGTAKTLTASGLIINDGNNGANYNISYLASNSGVITKKTINVTAQADNKVYDGTTTSNLVPLTSTLANGDNITTQPTQTFDNKNAGTAKTLTASGLIINDGNNGGNYNISYFVNNSGVITKQTTNVTAQADNKVYDGTTTSNVVPVTAALFGGDNITTQPTQTFDNKNAGTAKTLTASGLIINDGNNGANYNISYLANNSGIITPAKLIYTANSANKIYGNANPNLQGSLNGFLSSDTQANSTTGTLVFTTTATIASGVGNYNITGSGVTASNYTFQQATGNTSAFTINPRPIGITADNKSKIYGEIDPALTFRITSGNLVNGDIFTGSLVRTPGNNANNYSINQGSLALNANYTLSFQSASFIISKAVLNIIANHADRCFGNQNPTFTINYSGFQYGETLGSLITNPMVNTIANINSSEGNYDLIPSGAASSNYNFVYTNGKLTINPLPIITLTSDKGDNIKKGELVNLVANSSNGVSYRWSNASGIINGQNLASLKVRPLESTTYVVSVFSASGCQSDASITLNVKDDYQILIAENFITPNGDGQNDTWVVHNIDAYPNHNLTIVDRAGKIVYQTRNYKNDWDGTFQGSALQQGTYYYLFRFDKQNTAPKKGFITIVRQGQ